MKNILCIITLGISSITFAGGGHFHPKKVASCSKVCKADDIKAATHLGVAELIKWKMMDQKWSDAKVDSVEKKTFTKGTKSLTAWVATLSHAKDKRYVFFTEKGYVFRTNETGSLK